MARTNPKAVQGIIGVDSSINVSPFIDTAASLVTKVAAQDLSGVLDSDSLEIIERWLSAHFYAHRDQLMSSKSEGRASGQFQGQTAMVLNSTQYGQTAMLLDVTGYLAMLSQQAENGRLRPQLLWLGSKPQSDVEQFE